MRNAWTRVPPSASRDTRSLTVCPDAVDQLRTKETRKNARIGRCRGSGKGMNHIHSCEPASGRPSDRRGPGDTPSRVQRERAQQAHENQIREHNIEGVFAFEEP